MADEPTRPLTDAPADPGVAQADAEGEAADERGGGLSDLVRRAVSAGVGVAARSKEDIMRAAAGEMRSWLEHLNLDDEIAKALSKMVIEVKTEIRFRPNEDGKLVPEAVNDVKLKPGAKG